VLRPGEHIGRATLGDLANKWKIIDGIDCKGDGLGDIIWNDPATNRVAIFLLWGTQLIEPGRVFPGPGVGWDAPTAADFNHTVIRLADGSYQTRSVGPSRLTSPLLGAGTDAGGAGITGPASRISVPHMSQMAARLRWASNQRMSAIPSKLKSPVVGTVQPSPGGHGQHRASLHNVRARRQSDRERALRGVEPEDVGHPVEVEVLGVGKRPAVAARHEEGGAGLGEVRAT
jgi:hypothetical protein